MTPPLHARTPGGVPAETDPHGPTAMDPSCVLRTSASQARSTRRTMASSRCRLPHHSRTRAPSLHRRRPASAVLQAPPPPCRPGRPLAEFRLAHATPPTGLPVLLPSPSSMRAAATTPAEPTGACVVRFPVDGGPPRENGGSASALAVSGPARRSLALRPAWSLNRPRRPFSHSGSDDVVASIIRSDCYRLERPFLGGIRTRWRTVCSWQP